MDERSTDDPLVLQREIAEKRQDLVASLEQLRGTIRHHVQVGRQWRDRAVAVALVGGAIFSLFVLGSRALRRSRSRRRGGLFG
jgi:hypothetical protein